MPGQHDQAVSLEQPDREQEDGRGRKEVPYARLNREPQW